MTGNQNFKSIAHLGSQALCLALSLSLGLAPITPAFATSPVEFSASSISAGDTAKSLPGVGSICDAVDNAVQGKFVDKNGEELRTIVSPECSGKSSRELESSKDKCMITSTDYLQRFGKVNPASSPAEREAAITNLCNSEAIRSDERARTYCAIFNVSREGTQTAAYCKAYRSAAKAQDFVKVVGSLDVAAAGICWMDYLTYQATQSTSGSAMNKTLGAFGHMSGACGAAAAAASLGELVYVGYLLAGHKSGGSYRVDSDNNVKEKGDGAKAVELVLSSGGSAKGFQLGVCYYPAVANKFETFCKGGTGMLGTSDNKRTTHAADKIKTANQRLKRDNQEMEDAAYGRNTDGTPSMGRSQHRMDTAWMKAGLSKKELADAKYDYAQEQEAKAEIAHQAALVFTGLAVMRASSLLAAQTTKSKTSEILQSMFTSGSGTVAFGGSANGGIGTSSFSSIATASFASTSASGDPTSSAAMSNTPEAFMLPRGSALESAARNVASRMPKDALEQAASGGAAGVAGAISSVASSLGAKDTSAIRAATASMFANLPKEEGGYGGSGGGRSMASTKSEGSGDLNLKGLFGNQEAKEMAQAGNDMAFRELASEDDIFHSKNPKGNNLFQIISDKYDVVQRKKSLGQ